MIRMKQVYIVKNRYVDSVTLMGVAEKLARLPGVLGAESGMGTPANIEMLTDLGYPVPDDTDKYDLMFAIDAADEQTLRDAYAAGLAALSDRGGNRTYTDLEELPPGAYDLVQISLPGEYAAAEVEKALRLGMDVFVFSDNVPIEAERRLKALGQGLNRLVMGPDAGVGLMGGVALAAGSVVRPGAIGIVAASGSGAQEVACLIERLGEGVSEIIGTGGRDLRPEIGGITMRMGMQRLNQDTATRVICLVSKLADAGVMADVLKEADALTKPVVAVFLGGDAALYAGHRVQGAQSLQEAAERCVTLLKGQACHLGLPDAELAALAAEKLAAIPDERRYFRGLYCGGTFAEEALILFHQQNPQVPLHSNLPTPYAQRLASHLHSQGHTLVDMGAEDFTAEAPHPVFDPALRIRRLEKELGDAQVAVVLLDFITGPGVNPNPVLPFAPIIRAHPEVVFVTTLCGGEGDPQHITAAADALREAGAVVAASNHQSAKLAAMLMAGLEGRRQHG
jgi:succinyl-CoA synthetase alpha subunit